MTSIKISPGRVAPGGAEGRKYWEQGRKNITLENATRLLDALGLELVVTAKGGETHGRRQAENL